MDLSHVDDRCSFESIKVKCGLTDSGPGVLARILYEVDVAAGTGMVAETADLKAIAHGFALLYCDDDPRADLSGTPIYDAFYAWCLKQDAG